MNLSDLWRKERKTGKPPAGRRVVNPLGRGEPKVLAERYFIKKALGQGGMGDIMLAYDREVGREVVVKIVRIEGDPGKDQRNLERFKREARAMIRFKHPHIVEIFEYQTENWRAPFIVMEYIRGRPLNAFLLDHPGGMPLGQAFAFLKQLCLTVDVIHAKGVVHRDLKPDNIMIDESGSFPKVKILDFGLIHFERALTETLKLKLTQKGIAVGTPAYMSPEQCRGQQVTSRSDIYNLGLIAFEIFTGRPTFEEDHPARLLTKQVKEQPPSVRTIRQGVPAATAAAVEKALSKKPGQRFESGAIFWKALVGK